MLAQNGRVTAVVDFGSAGIGDLACDLMVAWTLLTAETRKTFVRLHTQIMTHGIEDMDGS
ncbi:MAG: phosphotransferase [Alphaproteobacteria bacterium]|nr:phosphotransferase [Alphaproteobacteria bacterium]MBP9776692.1 phosphotransferase [Alphaproteobacteria bacterium]